MKDAHFIVVNGEFVCDECGQHQDDHVSRVEVDGPMKGWTRYRCQTADADA